MGLLSKTIDKYPNQWQTISEIVKLSIQRCKRLSKKVITSPERTAIISMLKSNKFSWEEIAEKINAQFHKQLTTKQLQIFRTNHNCRTKDKLPRAIPKNFRDTKRKYLDSDSDSSYNSDSSDKEATNSSPTPAQASTISFQNRALGTRTTRAFSKFQDLQNNQTITEKKTLSSPDSVKDAAHAVAEHLVDAYNETMDRKRASREIAKIIVSSYRKVENSIDPDEGKRLLEKFSPDSTVNESAEIDGLINRVLNKNKRKIRVIKTLPSKPAERKIHKRPKSPVAYQEPPSSNSCISLISDLPNKSPVSSPFRYDPFVTFNDSDDQFAFSGSPLQMPSSPSPTTGRLESPGYPPCLISPGLAAPFSSFHINTPTGSCSSSPSVPGHPKSFMHESCSASPGLSKPPSNFHTNQSSPSGQLTDPDIPLNTLSERCSSSKDQDKGESTEFLISDF